MNKSEFVEAINRASVNEKTIAAVEKVYGTITDIVLKKTLSVQSDTLFFDDFRLLSSEEILHASDELHVDFQAKLLLPLIDCCDNDFIVFHTSDGTWSRFNIVDESEFRIKKTLMEVL